MSRLPSPTSAMELKLSSETERIVLSSTTDPCKKSRRIQQCLERDPVSLWELRELALSKGGLVNATFRRVAWPLIVGLQSYDKNSSSDVLHPSSDLRSIGATPPLSNLSDIDRDLLRLDSTRSVLNKYKGRCVDEAKQEASEKGSKPTQDTAKDLLHVLESVLEIPPRCGSMRYFQGMHDIVGVFLLNLADNLVATAVVRRLCHSHFREALRDDDFVSLLSFLKATLLPLLHKFDPELHDKLSPDEVMLPTIILPWIISWCLHDVTDPLVSSRLVDALLCGHSTFVLYLVISLLMAGRSEILNSNLDDDDPMMIVMTTKGLVSKIVSDYSEADGFGFPAQALIDNALILLHRVHPRSLRPLSVEYYGDQYTPPSSSFFWRATPSWALSSFPDHAAVPAQPGQHSPYIVNIDRARIATGVTHLLKTVVIEVPRKKHQHGEALLRNISWWAQLLLWMRYLLFRK